MGRLCGKQFQIARSPGVRLSASLTNGSLERIHLSLDSALILDCPEGPVCDALAAWLKGYAEGRWELFSLSAESSRFFQQVASVLQGTAIGSLVTYGELASLAGSPKAARAVGNFCRRNRFPLLVPCHRVIPSGGDLGYYTPDPRIKARLLEFESEQVGAIRQSFSICKK